MQKPRLFTLALGLYLASSLLFLQPAAADPEQRARSFLAEQQLSHLEGNLQRDELRAIGSTLEKANRQLTDASLAKLLKNPVAWNTRDQSRSLMSSLLKSLPEVAATDGIDNTVAHAANKNEANFRGFGTEVVATAALNRFSEGGQRAKVVRMGSMITSFDGQQHESDGAALIGADTVPRLVTIKSVSTIKAVERSMKKAASQLAVRNLQRDGSRTPGVILVGYSSREVLGQLQTNDWQAAANRSGAKVLVLAIDQGTGIAHKLASASPDAKAQLKAQEAARAAMAKAHTLTKPVRPAAPRLTRQSPRVVRPTGRAVRQAGASSR